MPYSKKLDKNRNWRKHYDRNREKYTDRAKARRIEARAFITSLKVDQPCNDCGVSYPPYVMDFDHRDPSKKLFSVSSMHTQSLKRIQQEVSKCDIVCANCHRIRTYS